jgi:hypothetical protein
MEVYLRGRRRRFEDIVRRKPRRKHERGRNQVLKSEILYKLTQQSLILLVCPFSLSEPSCDFQCQIGQICLDTSLNSFQENFLQVRDHRRRVGEAVRGQQHHLCFRRLRERRHGSRRQEGGRWAVFRTSPSRFF